MDDVQREFERLRELGVRFTQEPVAMGPVTVAVLDDTCGNAAGRVAGWNLRDLLSSGCLVGARSC
ncbi:hypothetical protein N566_10475 [Streptomycetaceae bacterium MP113-05]|nr:hypothetical protein N566_10475 [Streptomycetaceae bacterium MP113-05]